MVSSGPTWRRTRQVRLNLSEPTLRKLERLTETTGLSPGQLLDLLVLSVGPELTERIEREVAVEAAAQAAWGSAT